MLLERCSLGKPYRLELEQLDNTYRWSKDLPIAPFVNFIKGSIGSPLIAIGSGGSYTAAKFAAALHECTGSLAKSVTPFSFSACAQAAHDANVLILSAGGRNPDVESAFRSAVEVEPRQLYSICMRSNTPLGRWSSEYEIAKILECEPPCGKDGFLATNSLLATCVLLARSYRDTLHQGDPLPSGLDQLITGELPTVNLVKAAAYRDSWVFLHGWWSEPAAIDIESKLMESALVNVQVSDYRNFAHGRHNWLDKRRDTTAVIAFVTMEDYHIADHTLNLLPEEIPVIRLETQQPAWVGTIELLVHAIRLVGLVGKSRGIDPGRPDVAQFGRRIYHLRSSLKNETSAKCLGLDEQTIVAIQRKSEHLYLNPSEIDFWVNAYRKFTLRIEQTQFGAIILDYDRTICTAEERFGQPSKPIVHEIDRLLRAGILVGIATGRGKSVREALCKIVAKKYLKRVLVGYYNGADIATLDCSNMPNKAIKIDPNLDLVMRRLYESEYLLSKVEIDAVPHQITILPHSTSNRDEVRSLICSILASSKETSVRFVQSTHSLDILAPGVSKLCLVEACKDLLCERQLPPSVLCIGDMGKWPGNDYELLSTPYSLSVWEVSPDPETCWNLGAPGRRGVETTLEYLSWIAPDESGKDRAGLFRVKVGK